MNLLVAETAEGLLNLSDAFLYEASTDLYSRVVAGDGVPAQPALYQVIPWDMEHSGDTLKFKDPKVVVGGGSCTSLQPSWKWCWLGLMPSSSLTIAAQQLPCG
jgi:hypothetical protein